MTAGTHAEHDVLDPEGLDRAVAAIAAAPSIAVDVETNAMHAYRARLCFVQLGTDADIFVVDTLAPAVEPGRLGAVFADPSRRKIFHDAQGDLRVLFRHGLTVQGLFDTHRAATLLGLPKVGLGDLVETRFGVKLLKEHQTSDFGKRPLPAEVRRYVADDVRYLLPLAAQLEAEARELGIWEELELEFARIAVESSEPEAQPRPKLPPQARGPLALAVAEAVDRLRHRAAAERDVPVGRILANAAVGEIAARLPPTKGDLARLQGVKGSVVRELGEAILAAIAEAKAADARGELKPPERPKERPEPNRRDREQRLRAFRTEAATARKVTPGVVLPTPLLEQLATQPPADLAALAQVPWLGEKRLSLYGPQILAALRG